MTCTATKEKTADLCQNQSAPYPHEKIDGQDFVKLPGGEVTLGDSNPKRKNPVHQVRLDPFLIATTEVTNAQMDAYIADQGKRNYALIGVDAQYQSHILARGTKADVKAMNPQTAEKTAHLTCGALMYTVIVEVVPPADRFQGLSAEFAASDHPAVLVSWYDAIGYTDYMSKKTGREVRLLTEDEWEYAARGGKDFKYPAKDYADATSAVGYNVWDTNPYGLSDMMWNVTEFTSSFYDDSRHNFVSRGGSFFIGVQHVAHREYSRLPEGLAGSMGFRVAVSAKLPN